MPTNYNTLGNALKRYTDAMRTCIEDRLSAYYGKHWWDQGVISIMHTAPRGNIQAAIKKDPNKPKIEFLDPSHFPKIIGGNHDQVFGAIFPDYKKTVAQLNLINSARQKWAHPPSGDFLADEIGNDLFAMVEVLKAAQPSAATEIEKLRRELLKLDVTEPNPEATAQVVGSAPKGSISYWWEVAEPHDGFKNPNEIDESLFAATLGGVHAGSARQDYLNPRVFLSSTYFTENLTQAVRDVASRMSGGDGAAVTELQTPFGGGKTHALLTLYHLINSPEVAISIPAVNEALGGFSLPRDAKVIVFDGYEHGVEPSSKPAGESIYTLWGEIAYQADSALFRKLVSQQDIQGTAPGNAIFRQVLHAASPCLILIDELVSYLHKLKYTNQKRFTNLYRQTVQFVQELLQEAGNIPGVVVMISLPKSQREYGGIDRVELDAQLGLLDELQARADRVVSKRTPVNDSEIYTLMSRRLFKPVDRAVAQRAVGAYQTMYDRNRDLYDPGVFTSDYREQQINAYPFHPELIDVLYKKWSTASDFPRTRSVLQLLAKVVADQWTNHRPAHAIQSAHVNLERERIRTQIVAAQPGGGYDGVVAADIIGGDAHADMLDDRLGSEYKRHQISRGIATTILMQSFGGITQGGALPADLRLGTVSPSLGPEYVSEVLGALEESLWYVHKEGEKIRFQTRPNLYRIIAQAAETQPNATVQERLRSALDEAVGSAQGFRILQWAGENGSIADKPEPAIAVLSSHFAVTADNGGQPTGADAITAIWDQSGGGLRQWRNALILVAPDREQWARAELAMREVMAYEAIQGSAKKHGYVMTQNEEKDLKSRAKDKNDSLRTALVSAYRWIFYPSDEGLSSLPLSQSANKDERIAGRVLFRLSDQNYGAPKILPKMGAVYFSSKVLTRVWQDQNAPLDIAELARNFHRWTYLPLLPVRDETLRAAIREGISQKLWAVAVGEGKIDSYTALIEKEHELTKLQTLFDGSAWLVRGGYLDRVREQLSTGGVLEPGPDSELLPPPTDPPINLPVRPQPPIPLVKRFSHVTLNVSALQIGKTTNLQPYLFKVLAEQDAAAQIDLTINVRSNAGISDEALNKRIVEGLEQLGIEVNWQPKS